MKSVSYFGGSLAIFNTCGILWSWILGNPSLTSNDNKIVLLPLVLVDSSDLRLSVTVDTCCQALHLLYFDWNTRLRLGKN